QELNEIYKNWVELEKLYVVLILKKRGKENSIKGQRKEEENANKEEENSNERGSLVRRTPQARDQSLQQEKVVELSKKQSLESFEFVDRLMDQTEIVEPSRDQYLQLRI
ncbi:hypothetical protein Ancab_004662, partial [Ancistrocladus abbreviatus]